MKQVNAYIDQNDGKTKIAEFVIITNLECIENFIKLYVDNSNNLFNKNSIKYYGTFSKVFYPLVEVMEKKMGLVKKRFKDKIIIIPKNAALEQVTNIIEDTDVQWELIRYARENLSLSENENLLHIWLLIYILSKIKMNQILS